MFGRGDFRKLFFATLPLTAVRHVCFETIRFANLPIIVRKPIYQLFSKNKHVRLAAGPYIFNCSTETEMRGQLQE